MASTLPNIGREEGTEPGDSDFPPNDWFTELIFASVRVPATLALRQIFTLAPSYCCVVYVVGVNTDDELFVSVHTEKQRRRKKGGLR